MTVSSRQCKSVSNETCSGIVLVGACLGTDFLCISNLWCLDLVDLRDHQLRNLAGLLRPPPRVSCRDVCGWEAAEN